jgi:hypothetical protein
VLARRLKELLLAKRLGDDLEEGERERRREGRRTNIHKRLK